MNNEDLSRSWPAHVATGLLVLVMGCGAENAATPVRETARWWQGNLHTHTLWSDGDEYPEVVLDWYRSHGYEFVAVSDHNRLARGERWIDPATSAGGVPAFEHYVSVSGDDWVETREINDVLEVRLKTFDEYRDRVEVPGRFLIIQGEEITSAFDSRPIHVNATNILEEIEPRGGSSVREVLQNNVDAVIEQRDRTGQPMFPHINHPNFGWALTAEDIIPLQGERFFEVYNGHPAVHNEGNEDRPSMERIWDIILSERLRSGSDLIYGIAVDDAHHYQDMQQGLANPGRGWIMVRSDSLTPSSLISSMEDGDFYASTGIELEDVMIRSDTVSVLLRPELGIRYYTRFIGTRVGYDTTRVRVTDGDESTTLYRYSDDVGEVFAEINGNAARYVFRGDELYVRAVVFSTKLKENPYQEGELEMAWTQPIRPPR